MGHYAVLFPDSVYFPVGRAAIPAIEANANSLAADVFTVVPATDSSFPRRIFARWK